MPKPTPEQLRALAEKQRTPAAGPTGGSRLNLATSTPASQGGGKSVASKIASKPLPKILPQAKEGETVGSRAKSTFNRLTNGKAYFREVLGLDLDKSDVPLIGKTANKVLDTVLDFVANPASAASILAAPVAVPARLASTPLGRLAFRISAEAAIGATAAKAAGEVSERVPEQSPAWMKVAAPLLSAVAVGGASSGAINRSLRTAPNRVGANAAAEEVAQSARAAGYKHLPPLASLDEIREAFPATGANPVTRAFWQKLGVDPIRGETTDVGQYLHAWARQRAVAKQAAHFTSAKVLPLGFNAFKIGRDGTIENLPKARGIHWNDVFSDADAPAKYGFDEAMTKQWTQMHEVLGEVVSFAKSYGINRAVKTTDGKLYVPRQVRNAPDGVYEKPSDPGLLRVYEEATEAAANGERYAGPEQTFGLHLETLYKQIADKQLDDVIEGISILPSEAYRQSPRGANMIAGHRDALQTFRLASRKEGVLVRRANKLEARLSEAKRSGTPDRVNSLAKQLDDVKDQLAHVVRPQLIAARKNKEAARQKMQADFKSYKTSNRTKVPGSLFGFADDEKIDVKVWQNRFIPNKDYERLAKWFDPITGAPIPRESNLVVRNVTMIGDALRTASATADFSMPFIQGLPLLAENPVAWARMATKHYEAFFRVGVANRYIAKHADSIMEMIIRGRVPLGDVEFFTSIQGQGPVASAGRKLIGRFERSYSTGLLVARHELWQALRPTWKGSPEDLGKYVRNMTGGMDTAALGVGGGQRAAESLALFSPKLLRSTIALFADASRPWTAEGAAAAHTLLKLGAASAGVFSIAAALAGEEADETEEQIAQRMRDAVNPLAGKKFLSVEMDGNYYGVGGQVRAMAQFIANAITGGINYAADGTIEDGADNPLIPLLKFITDRTSPAFRAGQGAFELVTDEDLNVLPFDTIDDVPDLLGYIGKSGLPFVIQEALEMREDPLAGIEIGPLAAAITGARTSPITPSERRDDYSLEEFGLRYRELTPAQKVGVNAAHPEIKEAIKAFASKEEKAYQTEIDRANILAQETLAKISEDYTAGRYTARSKMRDDIESAVSARAIRMDTVRSSFGKDFEHDENTLASQVLNAYYATFENARRNPNDPASPLDFDVLDQEQATLNREIENEVFDDPARARQILAERTSFQYPPELEWFFKNKKLVQEVGYWDARDRAFKEIEADLANEPGMTGIYSAGQLMAKAIHLEDAGDLEGAALANSYVRAIDRVASREHRQMRVENPGLDRALLMNGYITKRITTDEELPEDTP